MSAGKRIHRTIRKRDQLQLRPDGCPMTRNRSVWCYGMCTPVEGQGLCGRIAHHALKGRTQEALTAQLAEEEPFDLESLDAPELWIRNGAW